MQVGLVVIVAMTSRGKGAQDRCLVEVLVPEAPPEPCTYARLWTRSSWQMTQPIWPTFSITLTSRAGLCPGARQSRFQLGGGSNVFLVTQINNSLYVTFVVDKRFAMGRRRIVSEQCLILDNAVYSCPCVKTSSVRSTPTRSKVRP